MRVDEGSGAVTQDRVLPASNDLAGLHPEVFGKVGSHTVYRIDEPSAAETRLAFGAGDLLTLEITAEGSLISSKNEQAAQWAAKHGGEISGRFWPGITEATRNQIREIITNAFLGKTPLSRIAEDIRNAGVHRSEPNCPTPTDSRKPECPYCQAALKRIPAAKTQCPYCGHFMYVRTRPDNRARVVVTDAEARRIDEAWEIDRVSRKPDDLAMMIAKTEISTAQIESNFKVWQDAGVAKVKWLALSGDPCPLCASNDGQIRKIGDTFPSGVTKPLAHVNCECILTAVGFKE